MRHEGWRPFDGRLWQRGYFDRIIRDEEMLHSIREYIQTNPLRWQFDRENPQRSGSDVFDAWLKSLPPLP